MTFTRLPTHACRHMKGDFSCPSDATAEAMLRRLADGAWHRVEAVGGHEAVHRHRRRFDAWGLVLEFKAQDQRGSGGYCRLRRPVDLVADHGLLALLDPSLTAALNRLSVHLDIDSSNSQLLRQAPPPGKLDVCIAAFQSAGKGRRGRGWQAPLGGCLCLSVGWRSQALANSLSLLPLAAGVTIRQVLHALTGVEIGLKWPNDLVWQDRKLGGILVERTMTDGSSHLVIGVGLNVDLPSSVKGMVSDWRGGAADLREGTGGTMPSTTELAAAIVNGLWNLLRAVESVQSSACLAAIPAQWSAADVLRERSVRIQQHDGAWHGTAAGVDDDGALRVRLADGSIRRVVAGDVSVRPDAGELASPVAGSVART